MKQLDRIGVIRGEGTDYRLPMKRIAYFVFFLTTVLGLCGCRREEKIEAWQPTTEIEKRLAQRVHQFYKYGQQHDHQAMYSMFSLALRGEGTKQQWLDVFEEGDPVDEVLSFKVVSVEILGREEMLSELQQDVPLVEKVALVEMEIGYQERGKEPKTSEARLDSWHWENDDWFYCGTN